MPRRKQTKPLHVQSNEEGEPDNGSKAKVKSSPSKTRSGGGGGGSGPKEELVDKQQPLRKGRSKEAEKKEQVEELEEEEEEEEDDEDSDEEKELLIVENNENDKDSDDSDQDSDSSEDLDQPIHNGTMTRRQASQLKEGGGGDSAVKKKNRTCNYCGVVKATPAALVRHLRKHTGERPFVCALCGKAYKAKRSLNLHENTVHKGLAKNPLPTQVPLESASASVPLTPIDPTKQVCGTPPISESTKSLLRETLESSRKARDANASFSSTTTTTTTTSTSVSSDDNTPATISSTISDSSNTTTTTLSTTTTNAIAATTANSDQASERLSAPNLVNLLTSDLSKKVEQILAASGTSATSLSTNSAAAATGSLSIPSSQTVAAQGGESYRAINLKKTPGEEEEDGMAEEEEEEEREEEEEEQAEDLSIHPKRPIKVEIADKESSDTKARRSVSTTVAGHVILCEFCPETFKHESAIAKHVLAAHNIILNLSHPHNNNNIPTPVIATNEHKSKFGSLSASLFNPTLTPTKKSSSSHHHQHKQKQQSSSLKTSSRVGEGFTKVEAKPTVRVSPQTWTGIIPTVHHGTGNSLTASDPMSTAFPSSLFAKQMKDLQATTSLLSPSGMSSSSSSTLSSSSANLDSMGTMMENGTNAVPMLGVSGTLGGAGADGTANGAAVGPMEENNALPYYITSRLLQDMNVAEVTLPDSDKSVVAEDGGHRRSRMTVMKETVLATRLDGINNITGRLATVYKCHLCQRVFSSLIRYNNHMPSHADMEVTTYDCRYCDASFRSHIQIIKHLQCHREKFAGFQPMFLEDPTAAAVSGQAKKKSDLLQGSEGNSPVPMSLTNAAINNLHNNNSNAGGVSLLRIPSYSEENAGEQLPTTLSTTTHEPGERKNGGYSCPKCRKNFTREYLLQRHMRIHRDQSSFYCPECESGFSAEQDLMDHKMKVHGLKSAEDHQKYKSLLSNSNIRMNPNPFKQFGKISDTNNNNNNNNIGLGIGGDSGSLTSSSTMSIPGVDKMTMPNPKTASGDNNNAGVFPVVDLKGIDLRLGEEVKVRMMGGLEDREKEQWMNQMRSEEYKKAFLSKFMEIQTMLSTGMMNSAGSQQHQNGAAAWRNIEQSLMRQAEERMKWNGAGGDKESEGRAMLMEKARLLRQQEQREEKLREENERKRKLEQAQLKAKLAQQGMGDVIIVLPDAPSPDENGSKKNSDTVIVPPPSTANSKKTAPIEEGGLNLSTSVEKRRVDHVGQDSKSQDAKSSGNMEDVGKISDEMKNYQALLAAARGSGGGVKRTSPESGSAGNSQGHTPAKSRRKALKPQKINHYEEEDIAEKEAAASALTSLSASSLSSGANGSNSKLCDGSARDDNKAGNATFSKETTAKEKLSKPNSDANVAISIGESSTLSQWKQLVALGGAQVFSASDVTAQLMGTPLNTALARTLSSSYPNKLMPGFDPSGVPVLFNKNNGGNSNVNSGSTAAEDGSCDNGEAMDLSTSTSADKDRGKPKSKQPQGSGPQFSSTPKPPSKSNLSSSTACSPIDSVSSSSSSSPLVMSYDVVDAASTKMTTDAHHKKSSSSSSTTTTQKTADSSFSRSISQEHDSDHSRGSVSDHVNRNLVSDGSRKNNNNGNQLNLQLPLNSAQFTNALLSGASGMNPETAALVGLPQVLWSAHSAAATKSKAMGKVNGNSTSSVGSLMIGGCNSNSNSSSKSRTSSPSPVPSPTGAGEMTTSSDGRKVTSLSRTHSRLSVVNEPLDRNMLCKPKMTEDGRSVYSCTICHKNFLSLSDINRHMDFHEDIRPFKCKYCDYYARTNSQLKVHKLRHEGVREFCCRVCNYKGVTQSDLNRHTKSQVHLLRSNHVCHNCGEGFVTPKALRDHSTNVCTGSRQDSSFERSYEKDDLDGMMDDDEEDYGYEVKDDLDEREALTGMDMRMAVG